MNINSLYGSIATQPTTNVNAVSSTSTTSSPSSAIGAAATATISTPGQFFSEMQQLSQTDPAKFKEVATQVAASFKSAAGQATGQQAQFLGSMADRFSQAAQTGSLAPAQSPTQAGAQAAQGAQSGGSAGGHHHHHHHGGGGGGMASSSDVDQAFQSAMSILAQATSSTSSSPSIATGATPTST